MKRVKHNYCILYICDLFRIPVPSRRIYESMEHIYIYIYIYVHLYVGVYLQNGTYNSAVTKNKRVHSLYGVRYAHSYVHNERTGSIHLRSCDNDPCAPCGTTAATHRTCRRGPHYSSAQLNVYNPMENSTLSVTVHDTHSRGLTIEQYTG
jgi:hypothetical protein